MKQNCEFIQDCLNYDKCEFKHKVNVGENFVENMVFVPECFKGKVLIKIEKPEFLVG